MILSIFTFSALGMPSWIVNFFYLILGLGIAQLVFTFSIQPKLTQVLYLLTNRNLRIAAESIVWERFSNPHTSNKVLNIYDVSIPVDNIIQANFNSNVFWPERVELLVKSTNNTNATSSTRTVLSLDGLTESDRATLRTQLVTLGVPCCLGFAIFK